MILNFLDTIQSEIHGYSIGAKLCDPKMVNIMGLAGECGEVIEPLKKHYRDGTPLDKAGLTAELGDALYYLSEVAHDNGIHLTAIVRGLLEKLEDRRKRNVMAGRGDHR